MRTSFPLQPETKELLYKRKGVLNRTAWVDSTETVGFILPLGNDRLVRKRSLAGRVCPMGILRVTFKSSWLLYWQPSR